MRGIIACILIYLAVGMVMWFGIVCMKKEYRRAVVPALVGGAVVGLLIRMWNHPDEGDAA